MNTIKWGFENGSAASCGRPRVLAIDNDPGSRE